MTTRDIIRDFKATKENDVMKNNFEPKDQQMHYAELIADLIKHGLSNAEIVQFLTMKGRTHFAVEDLVSIIRALLERFPRAHQDPV